MKKFILLLFLSSLFYFVIAQTKTDMYWVQLKDKNGSKFSVDVPSAYLSAKAIERRHRQNISINSSDLPVNTSYIDEIKAMDVLILKQSKWFNSILISCPDANKVEFIKALPWVIEVKKIEALSGFRLPSKFETEGYSEFSLEKMNPPSQPTATLNYGYSYSQAHQINVDCLHDMGYQGQGMTIAVLDAGFLDANILPAFDSLRMNNRLLGTRDFVTGDTMVFEDFPHGMNVLSCMTGYLPGQIIGTAPKASYWLLRTEDAASESLIEEINWLTGAEFADSVGADIINSSLGYNYFDNSADNHTYADMDGNTTIITKAADWAAGKGILVVASAGNYGGGPWYKITAPADADSVLTVGAVDSMGVIASLSSRGPTFDGRIKPNTVARGLNAVIAGNTGGITTSSGTSLSSPITAGAVACLWQANPGKTNMQLIDAIQQSASLNNNPDTVMGYGIPDFCAANTILTGIEKQHPDKEKLAIYPNPFEDYFHISFYSAKKQLVIIRLFDILGHEIVKIEKFVDANSNNTFGIFDAVRLPAGLYLLSVAASDKNYYEKIVKK